MRMLLKLSLIFPLHYSSLILHRLSVVFGAQKMMIASVAQSSTSLSPVF
jgi:hypothetical protein